MIGTKINDRYLIEAELGRGGMGVVYKGRDLLLRRPVAIKVVGRGDLGTEGRARLLREAQAVASLNQPNIVAVHDAGEMTLPAGHQPATFVVMELVSGQTLRDYRPADVTESVAILQQICAALEAAHRQGIIHRDLKAENVIRAEDGLVKLMDFGLARTLGRTSLTQEGTFLGTFDYLAPEVIQGQEASVQSDLYALGVLAYELLAGRRPFAAETPAGVLAQHLHAPPTAPSAYNEAIPPALEHLVVRLLRKRPEDRPESAAAVTQTLVDITATPSDPRSLIPVPRLDFLVRGRLVGREAELAQALRVWHLAAGGQRQVLLISGEPGIGKTRLATEIAVQAQLSGARVLQGQCFEHGGLPYMPLAQMIRSVADDETVATLSEQDRARLVRIAPDLARRWQGVEDQSSLAGEEDEARFLESLVALCQLIGQQKPLLLFFDDLQWADSGTISVIRHVVRRLPGAPLIILATYREVELAGRRPVRALLKDLRQEAGATRLKLGRLDRAGTEALLATLFAEAITSEFLQAIYHETEGNPFFVEELCKALVAGGQLTLEDGRWQRPEIEEMRLPQSIQLAITSRLERLNDQGLECLQAAAMLGREFGYDLLRTAVQAPETELVAALEEALKAQLVQEQPRRSHGGKPEVSFSFTHALIQATLLDGLGLLRRQLLARRLAESLAASVDDEAGLAPLLGRLYSEAGDGQKAVPYLLQAAEEARRLFAYEEAMDGYEKALQYLRQGDDLDRTARVLNALGASAMKAGQFEQSSRAYDEAFALWRRAPVASKAKVRDSTGRVFRLNSINPPTLDSIRVGDGISNDYISQLFECLVELGPDDEVLPAAASSWQILEGGRRYVFNLRDGAQWSDGVPVTAGDFEYAFKRRLAPGVNPTQAYLLFDIQGARDYHLGLRQNPDAVGVRAADPMTLVIDLEQAVVYFLHLVADVFPAPKHQVERYGDSWSRPGQLVNNGPFCLHSWEPGERLILVQNEIFNGWFTGNVERVEINLRQDMSLMDQYAAGKLDLLSHPWLTGEGPLIAERRFGADLVTSPGARTVYLGFNCSREPFDDARVRLAVDLAIDRIQLAREALSHHRDVAISGLIPPGIAGHGLGPKHSFDPGRARHLLAEAGYPDGQGLRELLFYAVRTVDTDPASEWLAEQMRDILGFKIESQHMRPLEMVERMEGDMPDLFYLAWKADYTDPDSMLRGGDWSSRCNWPNERFNQLVEDARTEPDQAARSALYEQAELILAQEAPLVPLFYPRPRGLKKPWVMRFPTTSRGDDLYKHVLLDDVPPRK